MSDRRRAYQREYFQINYRLNPSFRESHLSRQREITKRKREDRERRIRDTLSEEVGPETASLVLQTLNQAGYRIVKRRATG